MIRLEEYLAVLLAAIGIAIGGWFALEHYGTKHYDAGYAAAVEAGVKLGQADADRNRAVESDLRERLRLADDQSFKKEKEYATNLEAAQRRVRAGTDRLYCPAANPVQPAAAPGDRPAAPGPAPDDARKAVVPETAADLLGIAADAAGLVRKYERLQQRFESCIAVNAK